jgi:hypothetical protein
MIENARPKMFLLSVDYDWGRMSSEAYREGAKKFGGQIVGEPFFPWAPKTLPLISARSKALHRTVC